jgi:HEAT repeat protein
MGDPLEESEPMIVTTGGAALGPLGEVPHDEDMAIRDEEMENEIIIGHLKDELGDKDAEVRLSAVEILGVIVGGDKAIQALEGALTDEDEKVREMAAEELKRLKEEG